MDDAAIEKINNATLTATVVPDNDDADILTQGNIHNVTVRTGGRAVLSDSILTFLISIVFTVTDDRFHGSTLSARRNTVNGLVCHSV